MKADILNILRTENTVVSGERLSAKLGISRVSIWKHIQRLQKNGYAIEASAKGYVLTNDPDVLFPWEFPDRQDRVHYYPKATSTMDIARAMARKASPHLTVVIAGRQEKGRGRLQREWDSQAGGIYQTVITRPRIPALHSSRLMFAASLCLAKTLRELYRIPAVVKWPNDILVREQKICGMLAEMEAESDQVAFVNIGMGINANNDPRAAAPQSVSIKALVGRDIRRKELVAGFLDAFERQISPENLDSVITDWKTLAITIGRRVKIATFNNTLEGLAVDVDETGALILRLDDGSLRPVVHGDCFH